MFGSGGVMAASAQARSAPAPARAKQGESAFSNVVAKAKPNNDASSTSSQSTPQDERRVADKNSTVQENQAKNVDRRKDEDKKIAAPGDKAAASAATEQTPQKTQQAEANDQSDLSKVDPATASLASASAQAVIEYIQQSKGAKPADQTTTTEPALDPQAQNTIDVAATADAEKNLAVAIMNGAALEKQPTTGEENAPAAPSTTDQAAEAIVRANKMIAPKVPTNKSTAVANAQDSSAAAPLDTEQVSLDRLTARAQATPEQALDTQDFTLDKLQTADSVNKTMPTSVPHPVTPAAAQETAPDTNLVAQANAQKAQEATTQVTITESKAVGDAIVQGISPPESMTAGMPNAVSQTATSTANTANGATALSIAAPVARPGWGEAFTERVQWMANQDVRAADIHLNPPHLGPVRVQIEYKGDDLSVVISTHQGAVREAVEASLPKLRELLGDNNNARTLNVEVQVQDFQQRANSQQQGSSAYFMDQNRRFYGGEQQDSVIDTPLPKTSSQRVGLLDLYA
ncbi:MAG: flagellar hook-length control protein FliK [Pseudomonadota bacterium]